jgi:acyl-CoA dehydrogenase
VNVADVESRRRAVSAAKVALDRDGTLVAQWAVQLHGAIGLTEELDVGRLFRRMTSLKHLFGARDQHLARFWAGSRAHRASDRVEEVLGVLSAEERGFREEVREFYAEKLTPELQRAGRLVRWTFSEFEYGRRWQRILWERGWGAPHWPVKYGGCDWSARQHLIFAIETVSAQPPAIMMMGRDLCAPCIMQFGNEEQKTTFLPRILDGSDWWAQGYSEPQAGSDLAALQLRADDGGSCYVLNGSKIWTTFAHHANRIFCLVRTSRGARPQEGISFLLIDMGLPGIEVRPIIGIGGDHEFNQVFFTDVRVPKERLLGKEGEGWNVARYLLRYEHGAQVTWPMRLREWARQIELLASRMNGTGERMIDNPHFKNRLAIAMVELEAAEAIAVRSVQDTLGSDPPSVYGEMVNLRLRELRQQLAELMLDAGGADALVRREQLLRVDTSASATQEALTEALAAPLYFSQRGASIAGGTPEIHRNNIARKILDT